MKYAMMKRLVRLERSLASPLRPGGVRDACASVSGATVDALARAKRHAKPLGLGALLCCFVLDLLLSVQMHMASGEVAMPALETSASPTVEAVETVETVKKQKETVSFVGPLPRKAPYKVPVVLSEKEVASVLRAAGFTRKDVSRLTCTARFESGYNPNAKNRNTNGSQDSGLFQVNDVWLQPCGVTRAQLFDPAVNARCAKVVHDAQGSRAWMAFLQRRAICEAYRIGDFERKGHTTIRAILAGAQKKTAVSMASKTKIL